LPICLKDNSVSFLLHPQFFFNIYQGPVAAWCQVRLTRLCSNFTENLAVLAVGRATVCPISHFRQSASRTTPFLFYYTFSSYSILIRVLSLPGARYVEYNWAKTCGEVNGIGCDTCYSVSDSTFSPIFLKHNTVSLLLYTFRCSLYYIHLYSPYNMVAQATQESTSNTGKIRQMKRKKILTIPLYTMHMN